MGYSLTIGSDPGKVQSAKIKIEASQDVKYLKDAAIALLNTTIDSQLTLKKVVFLLIVAFLAFSSGYLVNAYYWYFLVKQESGHEASSKVTG